jgi:hypothetical protein
MNITWAFVNFLTVTVWLMRKKFIIGIKESWHEVKWNCLGETRTLSFFFSANTMTRYGSTIKSSSFSPSHTGSTRRGNGPLKCTTISSYRIRNVDKINLVILKGTSKNSSRMACNQCSMSTKSCNMLTKLCRHFRFLSNMFTPQILDCTKDPKNRQDKKIIAFTNSFKGLHSEDLTSYLTLSEGFIKNCTVEILPATKHSLPLDNYR